MSNGRDDEAATLNGAGTAPGPGADRLVRRARLIAWVLAAWSFAYACYRAYYAFGGRHGMIGRPVSDEQFRALNAAGSALILGFAVVLPLVVVRFRALWRLLPALGWIGAVGCSMHALVDDSLRLLSVTGVHPTQLPADVWRSVDRQAADLQDLLLNEPWFLGEGFLWAALGLLFVRPENRRAWLVSAVAACLALTVIGVLSGVGVIGSVRVG